ncbi:MAG: hypothetical protein HYR80_10905 [Nitrospirae bacterium]|nr:hypothetical protein [Nitrospirota bacterium]
MKIAFLRVVVYIGILSGLFTLAGCGGGGSSSSAPPCTICFTSASGSGNNLFTLSLNGASTSSTAVFDLNLSGLNTNMANGISADLTFDSSWMTFASFTPDTGTNGISHGVLSVLESDPNTLVIGLYKFKGTPAHLGTLPFNLTSTGRTATLAFSPATTYIGSAAHLLPSPHLMALGGVLKN